MRVLKVEEDGETGIQEEEALRERFLNLEGRAKQLIAVAAISEWGILEKKSSSNPTTLASSCNLLNISSIFKYPEQYNIKTFSHEKEGKKKII